MERSVLIIDDDPLSLKLERILLELENYQVRTAVSAEEALQVLKGFQPDLILLDLQLPGIDGIELTRQLKGHPKYKGIPIIIVTSLAHEYRESQARAAGCDAYLLKPIDTQALPRIVRKHLRKWTDGPEAENEDR